MTRPGLRVSRHSRQRGHQQPRVLFVRPYATQYPFAGVLPLSESMPRSAAAGQQEIATNLAVTGNKGNMAIGEAIGRIFDVDRTRSCYLNLPDLLAHGWDGERLRDAIRMDFDLVVLGMASAIRPQYDFTALAQIVEVLDTPFVVLGLGMQDPLPASTDALAPAAHQFLATANRKALIFGIRGTETQAWLQSVGLANSTVLGCPSMYLYPNNLLALQTPVVKPDSVAITAGHLDMRHRRSHILIALFDGMHSHYVMQDEIKLPAIVSASRKPLYNDATGEVNAAICRAVFGRRHGRTPPFAGYWYFQTMDAWRVFCTRGDFFAGDRVHGGIVAMQAGIPAVVLWNDLRARELTAFCGIPNLHVEAAVGARAGDVARTMLDRGSIEEFKDTYQARLARFDQTLRQCGLQRAAPTPGASQLRTWVRSLRYYWKG